MRASSVPAGGGAAGPDAAALQAVQYWVDNRPYDDRRNVSVIVLPDGQLGVGIEAVPIKPKFAKWRASFDVRDGRPVVPAPSGPRLTHCLEPPKVPV